MDNYEEVCSYV